MLTNRRRGSRTRQRLWFRPHDEKPKHEQQLSKRERPQPLTDDVSVLWQDQGREPGYQIEEAMSDQQDSQDAGTRLA